MQLKEKVHNCTILTALLRLAHILYKNRHTITYHLSRKCSDHIIIAISRKVPKARPKIVYKKSYKTFCNDSYVQDVKNIYWSDVCNEDCAVAALDAFMKLLLPSY
jgi:hypothetical protein